MSKFEKNMSEIFDIDPFSDSINDTEINKKTTLPVIQSSPEDSDLDGDLKTAYDQTRDNLQDLISQGMEAMEDMLHIAKEGQHPRAFEVYGSLLKNVVDANKELLNVQKQMREMENAGKKSGPTNIDKAVFIGTPSELNKMLKNNNE